MKKSIFGLLCALVICSISCKQASDLKAFTEAKYSLHKVQHLELNGIDVMQKRNPGDFTTNEGDSILASISDNTLQATTTLYLQVTMQDPDVARQMKITQLKWQLLVDGEETLNGVISTPLELQNGLNELPVQTVVKMSEADGNRNYEGLSKLMTLLSHNKDLSSNLTLQIKPTVQTPVGAIEVPQYIAVAGPAGS
ncbi:hypothetical protein [uncultured Pontibacter sp.]|uniref:hypothetical protein n=1 Tax=uncultured Pontibacter sp. TaxID=453356 RepID=UPI00260F2312|nr:hypothetical protein [uncultured Pontibacter sp.]